MSDATTQRMSRAEAVQHLAETSPRKRCEGRHRPALSMVTLPATRGEVIDALTTFSHPGRVVGARPDTRQYLFDLAINAIYDDTPRLTSHPETLIGAVLEDAEEAEGIRRVVAAADALFEACGIDAPVESYDGSRELEGLVSAAGEALALLRS